MTGQQPLHPNQRFERQPALQRIANGHKRPFAVIAQSEHGNDVAKPGFQLHIPVSIN
jgi:hypothetical protein